MTIIKYSEGSIIDIVSGREEANDEKAKKALKAAQQDAKNIDKAGKDKSK